MKNVSAVFGGRIMWIGRGNTETSFTTLTVVWKRGNEKLNPGSDKKDGKQEIKYLLV